MMSVKVRCAVVCALVSLSVVACSDDPAKVAADMAAPADMAGVKVDMSPAKEDMAKPDDMSVTPPDMTTSADMPPSPDMDVKADMAQAPDDMGTSDMALDMASPQDQAPDMPPAPVAADTCPMAADVTQGITLAGLTTVGAADDYNAQGTGCPSGRVTGGDVVFYVAPVVATRYQITVTPTNARYNPMIYVKSDCMANACLDGTVLNGPGVVERLTLEVPAGQRSYIIIDGDLRSGDAQGSFDLEIIKL